MGECMTIEEMLSYKNKRTWFNVGFSYFHGSELRESYIRAKSIDDALACFRTLTNDEIFNIWLFDEGDIEC